MQVAVIEFARHTLKTEDVNSTEFNKDTANPVIHIMPSQLGVQMGGSMRLGDYKCVISKNSRAHLAYQNTHILERHRHRYESVSYTHLDVYKRQTQDNNWPKFCSSKEQY